MYIDLDVVYKFLYISARVIVGIQVSVIIQEIQVNSFKVRDILDLCMHFDCIHGFVLQPWSEQKITPFCIFLCKFVFQYVKWGIQREF